MDEWLEACRVGALQSTESHETGASGWAQLTADRAAFIRTEANCTDYRLAVNSYPGSGHKL